ncbi:MAG: hypothetical protein LBH71_00160 [Oscillospiraceae bacterium]|jgi:hypothetical protein|nr:hypothetical protein [Oscillospiraceae bacterium]
MIFTYNTEHEAAPIGAWCQTRTRGVYCGDSHYKVTENSGMTVKVAPGLAWLKGDEDWGVNVFEDTEQILSVTDSGVSARTDIVCLKFDKLANSAELLIKKGASTAVSAPVRNSDTDEIYLAKINVRARALSILESDITDLRLDQNYCGIMRDGVTGEPTLQLVDQCMSIMNGLAGEANDIIGSIEETHGKKTPSGEQGVHGIRYHQNELQVKNDDAWITASNMGTLNSLSNEVNNLGNNISGLVSSLTQDGSPIIESGSNTNGNYVKYANGTMIQWMYVSKTDVAINNAYGSLFIGSYRWFFPQTFVDEPNVTCSRFLWGTGASWGTVSGQRNISADLRGMDCLSRAAGTNVLINACAIGKWK